MSGELPTLDRLRADLVRAMRDEEAGRAARRPGAVTAAVFGALLLALAGATAAGGAYYVLRASPIAPFKPSDSAPEQRVEAGTSRVLSLRSPDPGRGNPPWALRLALSQTGLVCGTVGQVVDRRFGIVGLDRRFRELPEPNVDACGRPEGDGLALLGTRVFDADRPADVRTVLNGMAGPDLERVSVSVRGRPARDIPHSPEGAFLLALRGQSEDSAPHVTLRWRGGAERTYALASDEFTVPDPLGGAAWQIDLGDRGGRVVRERAYGRVYRRPTVICAQVTHPRDRSDPAAHPPALCGRDRHPVGGSDRTLFYGARRLKGNGGRTALWGKVSPRVARELTVTGPLSTRRTVKLRPGGLFLVVLDSRVEPLDLRVRLSLRNGTQRTTGPDVGLRRRP